MFTKGEVPADAFNAATRNHKTTLGQFWKFVQTFEPGHSVHFKDVISKTRLSAFINFTRTK